jgi:hypothetical protein
MTLKLTRQECEARLDAIGIDVDETDSLYILQRAVAGAIIDGDLLIDDIC